MIFYFIKMKLFFPILLSLCLLGCIDEYIDSVELRRDGSALFYASIYPCEPDSGFIYNMKNDYDSIAGLKFDSAWFSLRDSLYSFNFKLSFENLFSWQGNKEIEKDFIGTISLKKIDSPANAYSFERIINPTSENEDGTVVPEESISPFALEQIAKKDSIYWEYNLTLPQDAMLINIESTDSAYISQSEGVLRWKIPASEAISKRIILKANFSLPPEKSINWVSLFGVIAGCIVMLLAIAMLIRKLKKLSVALKELKKAEESAQ